MSLAFLHTYIHTQRKCFCLTAASDTENVLECGHIVWHKAHFAEGMGPKWCNKECECAAAIAANSSTQCFSLFTFLLSVHFWFNVSWRDGVWGRHKFSTRMHLLNSLSLIRNSYSIEMALDRAGWESQRARIARIAKFPHTHRNCRLVRDNETGLAFHYATNVRVLAAVRFVECSKKINEFFFCVEQRDARAQLVWSVWTYFTMAGGNSREQWQSGGRTRWKLKID